MINIPTKLPFASHAELVAAFQAGAKFQVIFTDHRASESVTSIVPSGNNPKSVKVHTPGTSGGYGCFRPDGTNAVSPYVRLVMTHAAHEPASATPATPTPTAQVQEVNVVHEFTRGRDVHCPKTKEAVTGISYGAGGSVRVSLRTEAGVERVSTNYRADGTHRHQGDRNLKVGRAPKKVTLRVYKDPRNWNDDAYFVLSPIQVLPNLTAFTGLKPVATVEIDG
ncbi:hypothetical protein [Rhizobacter sp. Root1221]|uniref:hypothetical protein n=1 Tax=Rhizobacter sp. Root1221 TaxID=1736433 RepID=UPI0006FE777F|nr:hypothetical protein [Rhizobacter sp. Root1221]KQV99989.1 hypothetical protein ASC87_20015 [Rhizobacter sp. Root1221]